MNKPNFVPRLALEAVRPLSGSEPFSTVPLPADLTAEIDTWANDHEIRRSDAVRQLVELRMKAKK